MKISISSKELKNIVTTANRFVSNTPIVPIIENSLFQFENGDLSVISTDMNLSCIQQIDGGIYDVQDAESFCINTDILEKYIHGMDERPIHIEFKNGEKSAKISHNLGSIDLPIQPYDEFPTLPKFDFGQSDFVMDVNDLKDIVFSFGKTHNPNKSYQDWTSAVFFKQIGERLNIAGGSTLMSNIVNLNIDTNSDFSVIFEDIKTVSGCLYPNDSVFFKEEGNTISMFSGRTFYVIKKTEYQRQPFEKLTEANADAIKEFDCHTLRKAVDRVSIAGAMSQNKDIAAEIYSQDGKVYIRAKDVSYNIYANEEICENQGDDFSVLFRLSHLPKIIDSAACDKIALEISASLNAIKPVDESRNQTIVTSKFKEEI